MGPHTILLVDDEPSMIDTVSKMLESMGHTVFTAKDGVEAVEVFAEHHKKIQILLTDLRMPRMNGWETIKALRDQRPSLPVIVTTGYDLTKNGPEDIHLRPQALLFKPFGILQLRAALELARTGEPQLMG